MRQSSSIGKYDLSQSSTIDNNQMSAEILVEKAIFNPIVTRRQEKTLLEMFKRQAAEHQIQAGIKSFDQYADRLV